MIQNNRIERALYLLPRAILVTVLLVCIGLMVASNFNFFEPYLYPLHATRAHRQQLSSTIMIGPYPHLDELQRLKKEGVNDIISLLDTSLPQERALSREEEQTARRLGLEYWSFPLSYLSLQNEKNRQAAESISRLIEAGKGRKIYIHCYLGRHRVQFVRKILIQKGLIAPQ